MPVSYTHLDVYKRQDKNPIIIVHIPKSSCHRSARTSNHILLRRLRARKPKQIVKLQYAKVKRTERIQS